MRILFICLVSILLGANQEKTVKREGRESKTYIEKRIQILERRIRDLEKKIEMLEKKIHSINQQEEFSVNIVSKEVIKGKKKEIIKIEVSITNNTQNEVSFLFGQIHLWDPKTQEELFSDNFYYDKPIKPSEVRRAIIAVPSSHPSYKKIKDLSELKINFTPRIVKN